MLKTGTPESEHCLDFKFSIRWTDLVRSQNFYRTKSVGESGDQIDAEIKAYEHLKVLLEELGGEAFRIAVEKEVERKNGILMDGKDGNPQAEYPAIFDEMLGGAESKAEHESRRIKFDRICQFEFCRRYLDLEGDRGQRFLASFLIKYGKV